MKYDLERRLNRSHGGEAQPFVPVFRSTCFKDPPAMDSLIHVGVVDREADESSELLRSAI